VNESLYPEAPTQGDIRADLRSVFRGAIHLTLESLLEQEIRELVGASRWQRMGNRKDVRNGTYLRRLLTTLGVVELAVPRSARAARQAPSWADTSVASRRSTTRSSRPT
jgi:transposase-like protein